MKYIFILLLFGLQYLFSYAGVVKAISGEAYALRNGHKFLLFINDKIQQRDIIKTTRNTRLQIVFRDKTVISLGQKTTFKVDKYIYSRKSKIARFSVSRGIFKSITGRIGHLNHKKYTLKTNNATIGVRGTIYIGRIERGRENIACTSGEIVVKTRRGSVVLRKGEITTYTPYSKPAKPKLLKKQTLKIFKGVVSKRDIKVVNEIIKHQKEKSRKSSKPKTIKNVKSVHKVKISKTINKDNKETKSVQKIFKKPITIEKSVRPKDVISLINNERKSEIAKKVVSKKEEIKFKPKEDIKKKIKQKIKLPKKEKGNIIKNTPKKPINKLPPKQKQKIDNKKDIKKEQKQNKIQKPKELPKAPMIPQLKDNKETKKEQKQNKIQKPKELPKTPMMPQLKDNKETKKEQNQDIIQEPKELPKTPMMPQLKDNKEIKKEQNQDIIQEPKELPKAPIIPQLKDNSNNQKIDNINQTREEQTQSNIDTQIPTTTLPENDESPDDYGDFGKENGVINQDGSNSQTLSSSTSGYDDLIQRAGSSHLHYVGKVNSTASNNIVDNANNRVDLNFDLGKASVNGNIKFDKEYRAFAFTHTSQWNTDVTGHVNANGKFDFNAISDGYSGGGNGELVGEHLETATGQIDISKTMMGHPIANTKASFTAIKQ